MIKCLANDRVKLSGRPSSTTWVVVEVHEGGRWYTVTAAATGSGQTFLVAGSEIERKVAGSPSPQHRRSDF